MLNETSYISLRSELKEKLRAHKGPEKIRLDLNSKVVERLIFDTHCKERFNYEYRYRTIALSMDLLKKLDLRDVSFDDVKVGGVDFSGTFGVVINPQTVHNKNMVGTKARNVYFTSYFDDVFIQGASFIGSENANINPQTVRYKDVRHCEFESEQLIGSFIGTDYAEAKINGFPVNDYETMDQSIKDDFIETYQNLTKSFPKKP